MSITRVITHDIKVLTFINIYPYICVLYLNQNQGNISRFYGIDYDLDGNTLGKSQGLP